MTTTENAKPNDGDIQPMDNHATGVEIKPLDTQATGAPATTQDAGEEIQTLDNHATGPRP
ncbi:hypothetical protein [Streptomyces sp. NPDC012888]|uniref:hypothetical protein n=1 Tax=Streptomyces sp. NPDC012888 TaxID=3364855 RepID=UPI00369FDF47